MKFFKTPGAASVGNRVGQPGMAVGQPPPLAALPNVVVRVCGRPSDG